MKEESSITKLIGQLLIAVGTTVWRGYVLSVMWAWFIVATFGMPAITVPVAVGIMYGVMLFKHMPSKIETDNRQEYSTLLVFDVIAPAVVLLFGWIAKAFM